MADIIAQQLRDAIEKYRDYYVALAGGAFYPVIFGWMVHVYPFEDSREKIWGQ